MHQYSLDSSGELINNVSNVPSGTDATHTWSGLDTYRYYEWFVTANDSSTSTTSNTWSFTTGEKTEDTTAPSVTVDQPNGGERLGGSTFDIQWTATDDYGIATDGINLTYSPDNGSTWTTIATNETNDGTYNWTVPSINSTTVLVRVQATDTSGNTGQDVSDSTFTIDSTVPDLQTAETGDANGNGTVDTITATFTESVADSSVSTGDFSLSAGTVDSVSPGTTTDDDTVVLTVSGLPSGNTSATPDVTLVADSVTDLAGNTGPSTNTTVTASDGASPVMLSAVTGDADGNGHLDRVTVTYSEGVTQASTAVGDYDIGGATYEGESFVTDDDGDATLVFSVTELGTFDTGATPDVAYAQGTTADAGGNLMASQTITDTADGAVPVLVSTVPTDDATGVNTGTNLDATFSESVVTGSGNVEIRQSADDTVFEEIGITDSGKVSISGDTVTIDPDGTLSGNTGYYVLIDGTAIDDSSTNSFGGISDNTTWNFETADTTAPSVTVDQPNGGERLAGGSTFDILWTATDAGGIATDGIDLAYSPDGGTTWTTIATGETNDGTYTWTVPSIDSTTVLVRVQATDTSGNMGQDESDSPFEIDSTVPDLQGATTGEANGDGTVDTITATFTKSVDDSSVSTGDFSLSTGSVDSVSTGTTADDDTVILSVSGLPSEDTSTTPDVTLVADSVTDLAGNTGPSTDTTVTASDGASPVMLSAVTGDEDGDGHLDRVTVTYSEGVTQASTDVGDYDIGGATYEGESFVTDDDGDATLVFSVTELGTFDTGATPDVAYAQGTTADADGNLMASQTITDTTDGAAPVLVSTSPVDGATGVGTDTNLVTTLSESVVAGSGNVEIRQSADDSLFEAINITDPGKVDITDEVVTINPDGTLTGTVGYYVTVNATALDDTAGNSYPGISANTTWNFETADTTAPSVTVEQPNGGERLAGGSLYNIQWTATDNVGIQANSTDLAYSTDSGTTWTTIATGETNDGTYTWTVPSIDSTTALVRVQATDTSGNTGQDVSDSTFEIDSTVPDLAGATTADVAGDGTVDRVMVTFREPVDDGSIATTDFSMSMGTVEAVATGATADDASVVLTVSGLATNDTSVNPSVTVAASSVEDLAGNAGPSTDTAVTASDGAAPVLLSGVTDDGDANGQIDRVTLTFSEGVTGGSTYARDYNVVGYDGETIRSDDGDETLNVTVVESGTADSDATPEVTYTRGTSADASGNLVANRTIRARDGVGDDDGSSDGDDDDGSVSTGGGGGGSTSSESEVTTTETDGQATINIYRLSPGGSVNVGFSQVNTETVSLQEVSTSFDMGTTIDNTMTVQVSETPPAHVPEPEGGTHLGYTTIEIEGNLADSVTQGKFTFNIDPARLEELDAAPEDVSVMRHHDGEWQEVTTTSIDDTTYRVTTPGYSTFAITVAQTADMTTTETTTVTETETTTATTETTTATTETTTETTETTTETTTAPETTAVTTTTTATSTSTPGFGPVVAVIALLVSLLITRKRA
ncbi:Ig-like domain-containing protein [Halanaeroarchaeum sulfurireducens]|nr:Ig-like domain-containing protein [Halanaeroarchaeum sulfurireducens]